MNSNIRPAIWFRFGHTFTLFDNKDNVVKFLDYLNSRHDHIKFIIEFEQHNEILFLDVLIKGHHKNSFSTSTYRTKTFTWPLH